MPTTTPFSTTGKPEIRCARVSASTSRTVIVGGTVMGSLSTPDSKRLTLATSAACALGFRFLCTMPMPPSWARAIARRDSVTVSMAAESRGRLSCILRVRRVARLTSRGRIAEWAGTRRTSSNVSAFWSNRIMNSFVAKTHYTREHRPLIRPPRCPAGRPHVRASHACEAQPSSIFLSSVIPGLTRDPVSAESLDSAPDRSPG